MLSKSYCKSTTNVLMTIATYQNKMYPNLFEQFVIYNFKKFNFFKILSG